MENVRLKRQSQPSLPPEEWAVRMRIRAEAVAKDFVVALGEGSDPDSDKFMPSADDNLRESMRAEAKRKRDNGYFYDTRVFASMKHGFNDEGRVLSYGPYTTTLFCYPVSFAEIIGDDEGHHKPYSRDAALFLSVIDINEGGDRAYIEREPHVCPNCGHPSTIGQLHLGCEYCGTRYEIADMFPRVFEYHLEPGRDVDYHSMPIGDVLLWVHRAIIFTLVASCIIMAYAFFGGQVLEVTIPFSRLIIAGVIFGSVAVSAGIYKLIEKRTFKKTYESDSRKRAQSEIGEIAQFFSYDYFEADVVSSMRQLVFAENPGNCSVFAGNPDDVDFSDAISAIYMGGLEYVSSRLVRNRWCEVEVMLPMRMVRRSAADSFVGTETYSLTIVRDVRNMYSPAFSVHAVKCPNCAGSFDAFQERKCPYCGQLYDPKLSSWVIVRCQEVGD